VAIHGGIDPHDGPLNHGPIFALNCYLLTVQFLQELDKLHGDLDALYVCGFVWSRLVSGGALLITTKRGVVENSYDS